MFELENFPEACLNKFTVSCNRLQIVVPGRLWTKTTVGKNWVNWVDGKCLRGKMTKVNNNRLATLSVVSLSLIWHPRLLFFAFGPPKSKKGARFGEYTTGPGCFEKPNSINYSLLISAIVQLL